MSYRDIKRMAKPAMVKTKVLFLSSALLTVALNEEIMFDNLIKVVKPSGNNMFYDKLKYDCKSVIELAKEVSLNMLPDDLEKARSKNLTDYVSRIEGNVNFELLAFYMMFMTFNEGDQSMLDKRLHKCLSINYLDIVIMIMDNLDMSKDLKDDMEGEMWDMAVTMSELIK